MLYRLKGFTNLLSLSVQRYSRDRSSSRLRTMCKNTKSPETPRNVYHWVDGVEDLETYVPGGFHPTHLGDELSDGRYRIIHKLGFGGYSTGTHSLFTYRYLWWVINLFCSLACQRPARKPLCRIKDNYCTGFCSEFRKQGAATSFSW